MNIQNINITNKNQQPNFKGIRLPSGEIYRTIYPNETSGIRKDIQELASQGRLTKDQVSSLHQMLGKDDIHLEKSDGYYLIPARKFSMINKKENFKALEQIIQNALTFSKDGVFALYNGVLKIKQNTAEQVTQHIQSGNNANFFKNFGERCREAFVDSTINQTRIDA